MKVLMKEIQHIRAQSLSSVILRQLEEMILSGQIKAGERINESKLATTLQVSRAPIREACRQLEKHGMVEVLANRGTFVRFIQAEEVEELYDVRASLEALAGERAVSRMTEALADDLRSHLSKMEGFANTGSIVDYYDANAAFHAAIIRASGNSSLEGIYDSICKRVQLFRKTSLSLPDRLNISLRQHQEILESLLSGNEQKAGHLLKHHVLDAGRTLVSALTKAKVQKQTNSKRRLA
jgi:DNA-binding GntR family transcriptional regulator